MKRSTKTENGSSSVQFVILLLFVSTLIIATGSITFYIKKMLSDTGETLAEKEKAEQIAAHLYQDLKNTTTPESDSMFDRIWSWNNKVTDGYTIAIQPLSDRINPNFIRKNLINKTAIQTLLVPGKTADDVQQYREDNGLQLAADGYKVFFDEKTYDTFFSCYGWANINLVDEFAARMLALHLTGSETRAMLLHDRLQQLLSDGILLTNYSQVHNFLGIDNDTLYPFFTIEPQMNVHFVDPLVLQAVLSYPDYELEDSAAKYKYLLSLRERTEISQEQLVRILNIDKQNRLYYYFGTITWFWKIVIQSEKHVYEAVFCRLPPDSDLNTAQPVYTIIETRFQ